MFSADEIETTGRAVFLMKFQFVLMEEIPCILLHLIFSEELAKLKCVKKKKELLIYHEFGWYLLSGSNTRP